jgi:hypothetical protein
MALTSPGVEVTIIDQSQYLPAPTNSIPLVVVATAQDKANAAGTGVAQATTAANANKLYLVTSQRDLVTLYGNPFFYTTTDGTPIQGYELNEYGLLAAYSALGVTNQCFVLRADIDLASLVGNTGRPTGNPADGSYWLDTDLTTWGINEFNQTTGQFVAKTPIIITDSSQMIGNFPSNAIGAIGDYAIYAAFASDVAAQMVPTNAASKQFFYKNAANQWVSLGTSAWLLSVPTVIGTESSPSLDNTETITVSLGGGQEADITGCATVNEVATAIQNLGWQGVTASVNSDGRLQIISKQVTPFDTNKFVTLSQGSGETILDDIGIDPGTYYQPKLFYGTSAQQPLWQTGQSVPRPTGSVWIKVGSSGNGLVPQVSEWNDTASIWEAKNVNLAESNWAIIASLDSTGGQAIPEGTLYGQYDFDGFPPSPVYLWRRGTEGPTVVTGTNTAPSFTNGPYTFTVQVTSPGSAVLSSAYTVTLGDNTDATDFVTAWYAANIPYTTAEVLESGAIQLTHTEGGEIIINDFNTSTGQSTNLMTDAGFDYDLENGVSFGPSPTLNFTPTGTGGSGSNFSPYVAVQYGQYDVTPDSFFVAGTGYTLGDRITFAGTEFGGASPANDLVVEVTGETGGVVTAVTLISGTAPPNYTFQLTNWKYFDYTANATGPRVAPDNGANWFYSVVDQVDIMINTSSGWKGYKNSNYDSNGFPIPTGTNTTDPNGPIVSASEPTTQSDGTSLVYGDLWVSTADLENYPVIYRWQSVNGFDQWVLIDNTDQVSSTGILFADARWATNGTTNPANDAIPTITSLLSSNYLDLDAPETSLYPVGMLLFNTRRSGYNVKQYRVNYFNQNSFPDEVLPTQKDAWVSASGLQFNGAPYMGRKAQRAMVVQALRASVDTNQAIRDEDNNFNLSACPNYPELQPNLVVLNSDRGETGYILGDTPMRLPDDATAIQAWATNAAGAASTGEDGCVTRNTYLGLFYPSGLAPDLSGNLVAVPASHMMLRTFLRNDTIAYPWLAAAGTRRGIIDNATSIGYLDSATGEFQVIKTRIGIRDVLYTNFINPLVFFTGNGLLNYGNKTSFNSQSALDRTNVARLVAYLRRQLTIAARPFVFEPNDPLTRQQISGVVESLLVDLVAKRGLFDYLVVCDESNNTPARIDRNELWIDVAVEPVKAAEFIYIPVRILNTGELSGA